MKSTYATFIALAIPLFVSVGCASTDTDKNLTLAEIDQASTEQAIENMDAYMAHIETQDEVLEKNDVELIAEAVELLSVAEIEAELMLEAPELIEFVVEENVEEVVPVVQTVGQPDKNLFHFAFDKQSIDDDDLADIKHHAQYLLQYPNLTVVIYGHTDSFGAQAYNQKLSERRAQGIAEMLMVEGVPEIQIQVTGLADSVPVTALEKYQENRRVELTYQDSLLVSK